MAAPTTLSFTNFKVYINTANSPDLFVLPCGFTQKALTLSAASTDTLVPDCDDPTAAAWTQRAVSSLSGQISGQGVLAMESLDEWRSWFLSGAERLIRVLFDATGANNGGYLQGEAILTNLGFSTALNADGNKVQLQVTIDNAGQWYWTAAA